MGESNFFCYGSLMQGERNSRYLQYSEFIGRTYTKPVYDLGCGPKKGLACQELTFRN